jgi:hypothetical protein
MSDKASVKDENVGKSEEDISNVSTESEEEDAPEADAMLFEKPSVAEIPRIKSPLKETERTTTMMRLKQKREMFASVSDDGLNPWFRERDCLLLLLEARMVLKEMINMKLKEERTRLGHLTVGEMQDILKTQKEDQETDWIAGMKFQKKT